MRAFNRRFAALAYLLLSLGSLSVFGQEGGVMLTISNDTSDNLLVSIYDLGTSTRRQILSNRPIYGNASSDCAGTQSRDDAGTSRQNVRIVCP
jgi:hypothetical protein